MAPACGLEKFIMLRRLLRVLFAVVVFFSMSLPFAVGQSDSSLPSLERGVKLDKSGGEKSTSSPSAFPYFAMAIYTILIMTIVCMPSRKA
jgi:hypothetical protein